MNSASEYTKCDITKVWSMNSASKYGSIATCITKVWCMNSASKYRYCDITKENPKIITKCIHMQTRKQIKTSHINPFTPGILKWTHPAFNLGNSIHQKKGVSQTTQAKWQRAISSGSMLFANIS